MRKDFVPVTLGSPRFVSREVQGFLVTEAHFPQGLALPMHVHERATVAVMLEGSFDCTFPRRSLACASGTLHTEPAEERHGNQVGSGGAHVVVVQPDQTATTALGCHGRLLDQINYAPRTLAAGLAWSIARELHRSDTAVPLTLEGLTLELFGALVRSRKADGDSGTLPAWLAKAQEYVHGQFKRSFRIPDLAREVEIPPVRLARAFRRHFGLSIGAYARKLRLDWAAVELASSETPIPVIAARAGFADQSHFTRAFREYTGLTPRRFRNRARNRR